MSPLYVPALVTHVVIAILGVGCIAAIALLASTARKSGRGTQEASMWLRPLLQWSGFSLAGMFITGILLNFAVGGAYHTAWWFRGSALLLILTGVLHARARRAMRAQPADAREADLVLRRVQHSAYGMSALVAVITALMQLKPF